MTDQYIITEEQLKEISTIDRYTTKMYNRLYAVRSHPYNPQAEIETQCKKVAEKLIFDRCDECCDKCIFCDNAGGCLAESYRNKRAMQAEREKVLDELTKWCKQQWFEVESDEGETYSVIHVGDILAILEELRQEGKVEK